MCRRSPVGAFEYRCVSVPRVLCVPAHPPRFRAWSSFSRDRDVALTRLPFVQFDEPPINQRNPLS
jgi:hypothetical protein